MPIFMHGGGYGAFAPAMLVYRENTTPITIKDCNAYFHARGWLWGICSSHAGLPFL